VRSNIKRIDYERSVDLMDEWTTRSALGRAHLPPTAVFRRLKTMHRCFDGCSIPVCGIFPT